MAITEFAKEYHEKMFPGYVSDFLRTDPEFIERFDNFAFDEVINQAGQGLDDKTRFMAILATLLGCQGVDEFRAMLPAAMNFGVTPVEIKEITYQAVAYLGIGRVFPFLKAVNMVLEEKGVSLPLEGQAMTTTETDNCFGDYYTRTGLSYAQREMITFCFLAAQGGCEPQLTAHAAGNMKVGNDKAFLIRVISQCLPFIGYPRSLNALACVNKAAEADAK